MFCRSTNNSNTEPSQKTETNIENEDLYKHSWDLPPPEELFWQSKTIHNGEQTFYGQVWPEVNPLFTEIIIHSTQRKWS